MTQQLLFDVTQEAERALPDPALCRRLISCLDLTALSDIETTESTQTLCLEGETALGHVAALCIFPQFLAVAKEGLKETSIKLATVINFPAGNGAMPAVLQETVSALESGAD